MVVIGHLLFRVINGGWQKNNRLVFEETTKVITSLLEGDWRDKGEVAIDSVRDLMKTVGRAMRFLLEDRSDESR